MSFMQFASIGPCTEWGEESIWEPAALGKIDSAKYDELRGRISRLSLFPEPSGEQGESWPKPENYLAVALLLSSRYTSLVMYKLDALVHCKSSIFNTVVATETEAT